MAASEFEELLAFGQEGEHLVAQWLMHRGAVVSPLYQFTNHGKAPVLLRMHAGETLSQVLPDLTCWRDGSGFFAEVKRKRRWVRYYKSSRGLETGFNLRHWREYLTVTSLTCTPLWFFFLHETDEPTGLWVGEAAQMLPHVREWDGRNERTGQRVGPAEALFPRRVLRQVAQLEDLLGTEAA